MIRYQKHIHLGPLRSLLFAPGNQPHKLAKGLAGEADAVIADLEDGVAPADRSRARKIVSEALASDSRPLRMVRINGVDSEDFVADLELLGSMTVDGIVLPKATPSALAAMPAGGFPIIALVETSHGLQQSREIAAWPSVHAVALGAEDLRTELGLHARDDELEILFARSTLVLHSTAAGLPAPIDVVYRQLDDPTGLERSANLARSLGFGGKLCIHPAQVAAVNRVFAPSDREIDWARRILAAVGPSGVDGGGVSAVDGEMIDAPVLSRARRVLNEAKGVVQ